ncbi:MAG: DNA repair protein RecN [Acidobacteriota bacterium]|nr:DNA repair protein RecN [Acidobacteriota bacterium]
MLRYLKVNNLAVIDLAELEFESGFVCLTGESGAGKSVLIDAMLLLMGRRASSDIVRAGCDKAVVEAEFEPARAGPELELLEDNQLYLRREITAEGRSRAFVNGVMVPNNVLSSYAELAFEIHGQHGQQRLLKKTNHLTIFEDQTGLKAKTEDFRRRLEKLRADFHTWWELKDGEAQRLKEIDFLRLQIHEIDEVKPTEEDASLEQRLKRARNQETIRAARAELSELLNRDLGPGLTLADKLLATLVEYEPDLAAYQEQLTSLEAIVSDLYAEVAYNDDVFDEAALRRLETRETALNKLYMKYGRNLEEVLTEHRALKKRLEELSGVSSDLDKHRAQLERDYAALRKSRKALIAAREKAIGPFARKVQGNLRELAMSEARFEVHHRWPDWPETLTEERRLDLPAPDFHFLLSSNPGEPVRPLSKIASGGELSRVLLALIGAFTRPTARLLVFDEIDAGLGGETAHKVGAKLAELGEHYQVLCVTHFAQVARFAAQMIKLEKKVTRGRTATSLVICDNEQRVDELARLMGGDAASKDLREHARKLLSDTAAGR